MLQCSEASYILTLEGDDTMLGKFISNLKNWWIEFKMTPDELYLSKAVDVVDLEHRLQEIARKPTTNGVIHNEYV